MDAQNVAFGIIAAGMVFATIGVVTVRNVVHAALYLVVVLGGVAAQYVLLAAEFVAWAQVLVYIGAVLVLFLFGIMLTRAPMQPDGDVNNPLSVRGPAVAVSLFLLGTFAVLLGDAFGETKVDITSATETGPLADSIFRTYVIPFELVSMLLLAALVGAIVIARRD